MDVFVARFPVFDGSRNVSVYELSFRPGYEQCCLSPEAESEGLTALLNFEELAGGKKVLVHFSRELMLTGFPQLFSADAMIPCVDGTLAGDGDIVARCQQLRKRGYLLAVDNFSSAIARGPLCSLTNLARVHTAGHPAAELQRICDECSSRQILVGAQDIDTQEQFTQAARMGFALFQGAFFSRPDITVGAELGHNQLTCMRLIREVNQQPFSYDTVAGLIEQDVGLTYRLLRLINSTWFGLRYEVRSIRHALVLLGPNEVQQWASLVALTQAGEAKPELLTVALTRAKFAESLAVFCGLRRNASELFLMGMFSVLDALMDQPMEAMLAEVPLSANIKNALLAGDGPYAPLYKMMLAYERADWPALEKLASSMGVPEAPLAPAFRHSIAWATKAMQPDAVAA
jgi:EAL and modified HD-GYP domain-containing signal transduction protein